MKDSENGSLASVPLPQSRRINTPQGPRTHHLALGNGKDYLVSGAAGYVSFCQGAPDNVLDGFLDVYRSACIRR